MATLPLGGEVVGTSALTIPRARELADHITSVRPPFVHLVECRRLSAENAMDILVVELEVELPQRPVNPVRSREVLAILFSGEDDMYPEVVSLRPDFPLVPHLNLRAEEFPRSLCLYEEPWPELRLRWTPRAYLERLREWLALTARGELHAVDQALEPLFLASSNTFVLSNSLAKSVASGDPSGVAIARVDAGLDRFLLLTDVEEGADKPFVVAAVLTPAQATGVIRRTPTTLEALHSLLIPSGLDLVGDLRTRFAEWGMNSSLVQKQLVLLLVVPKLRSEGDRPESVETWAFLTDKTVADVGIAIDLWQRQGTGLGLVLSPDAAALGGDVHLLMLNVVRDFSPALARQLNGVEDAEAEPIQVLAVGVGALGSQLYMNLARSAWAKWSFVDVDYVLPHNLARHALPRAALGFPKSLAMAAIVGQLITGPPLASAVVADILRPRASEDDLNKSLDSSELVLDASASVPVSRHLARDRTEGGRRISIFLNPTGTDLVVLIEPTDRLIKLDHLEMQYYRAVLEHPQLHGHLEPPAGQIRYGRGCRDVTSRLPQDLISLHASVGARIVRLASRSDEARIIVFRVDPDVLTVDRIDVSPVESFELAFNDWRLVYDAQVISSVAERRRQRLPAETGGVLIGCIDAERKIVYVLAALASPPDSVEWPTTYIRGSEGLAQDVENVIGTTGGQVEYVGEWHSHPDGHSANPSATDEQAFERLAGLRRLDGLPAVFLIMSDMGFSWHVEEMSGER